MLLRKIIMFEGCGGNVCQIWNLTVSPDIVIAILKPILVYYSNNEPLWSLEEKNDQPPEMFIDLGTYTAKSL